MRREHRHKSHVCSAKVHKNGVFLFLFLLFLLLLASVHCIYLATGTAANCSLKSGIPLKGGRSSYFNAHQGAAVMVFVAVNECENMMIAIIPISEHDSM